MTSDELHIYVCPDGREIKLSEDDSLVMIDEGSRVECFGCRKLGEESQMIASMGLCILERVDYCD